MNTDRKWLEEMAAKEDGCDVSVGADPATVKCSWCGGTLLRKLSTQPREEIFAELLEAVKYLRNYAHLADLSDITAEHLDKIIAKAEAPQTTTDGQQAHAGPNEYREGE